MNRLDFLWPDNHHDAPPPWPKGTLAAYYCELFDDRDHSRASPPRIRWFETAIALLLGRGWGFDRLGPHPITDVMVESDGTWEPLDTLRICGNGITRTGLDVRSHDVEENPKCPAIPGRPPKPGALAPGLPRVCVPRCMCGRDCPIGIGARADLRIQVCTAPTSLQC